jgi:hypothetical protein
LIAGVDVKEAPLRREVLHSELVTFLISWPESLEEHPPTSIAGVLRLRAINPSLCDGSARRFAQDDDFVGLGRKHLQEWFADPQVPPLRSAPVGMTNLLQNGSYREKSNKVTGYQDDGFVER